MIFLERHELKSENLNSRFILEITIISIFSDGKRSISKKAIFLSQCFFKSVECPADLIRGTRSIFYFY